MLGVRTLTANFRFKKCKIRLYNLFNSDQVLTDTVNEALNANMDVITAELLPTLNRRLEEVWTGITENFLKQYTRKQLFESPDD